MKHPEMPGAAPAHVLRLAQPPPHSPRRCCTPALPRAHENDFGAEALAKARNAEMVRDLEHDRAVIAAYKAEPTGVVFHITVPPEEGSWHYVVPDGTREVYLDVRKPFATFKGVPIFTDERLKPREFRIEKAGELYALQQEAERKRLFRIAAGALPWVNPALPKAEREYTMMRHAEKMAADLKQALSLAETNQLRRLYGLEELEPAALAHRLWSD